MEIVLITTGPSGKQDRRVRASYIVSAVIAAINARAAALGLTTTPAAEQLDAARTEGWIALPTGNLADLVQHPGRIGRASP